MLTQSMSIETFEKNMDEIINCPYVLSEKKIAAMLKAVSLSRLFYELFDFCTSGFNYAEARKKYFSTNAAYGRRFVLPPDGKTIIAFGFSVLYCIDSKDEDFVSILNQFFYEPNVNSAYKRFCKELLIPFKIEVLSVANAMIRDNVYEAITADKTPLKKNLLSDEDVTKIRDLLEQSKSVILQYKIEPELKTELIVLYNAFSGSLYEVEPEKIKVAYLGYKYGILFHKKHDASLLKVEDILKNGGIL
ncbi:MAG: hypothetical protein ILP02_05110 [Clostridia bacterium]|nr:hypothetical protein [Clostridia bacterium]